MVTETTFTHPELGSIVGIARGNDVVQFRGIPFADIPGRFRQCRLKDNLLISPLMPRARATIPSCPQQAFPQPAFWDGPLPDSGVELTLPPADEFKCLNLNITVPAKALCNPGSNDVHNLPVLVYIHSGGFAGGSQGLQVGGRELIDPLNVVSASRRGNQDILVVTINYRVGVLGFLAEFNKANGEAVGNYALHDQRCGLEWVSRYVSGFGGDCTNITIYGGSVGGASCHYQSLFADRVFKRAILSSRTAVGMGSQDLGFHQQLFDSLVQCVEGDDEAQQSTSDCTGLAALQVADVSTLMNKLSAQLYHPLVEGSLISSSVVEVMMSNLTNAPDIMVGSCADEIVFAQEILTPPNGQTVPPEMAVGILTRLLHCNGLFEHDSHDHKLFSPSSELAKVYGIQFPPEPTEAGMQPYCALMADILFRIPSLKFALDYYNEPQKQNKIYLYDFRTTCPFPGWPIAYGKSVHALTDLFFFDPAGGLVPEIHQQEYSAAVRDTRRVILAFMRGESLWAEFSPRGVGESTRRKWRPVYTIVNGDEGKLYETIE